MGRALAAALVLQLPPLASDEVLEPSVRNEVDHALAVAPTNAPPADAHIDWFSTNGLSATEIAIKLVSSQGADGRWMSGTNDLTSAAAAILRSL